MKLHKLAILAVAFIGIVTCGQLASAQDASTNSATAPNLSPGKGAGLHRMRTNAPGALLQELNLSPEQAQQVRPIIKNMREKMQALQQEGALTPEEKMSQAKEIHEGAAAKLKTILSPDQFVKFQELEKNMRQHAGAAAKGKMPGNELPSNLPTNSVPSPGLGQNTN